MILKTDYSKFICRVNFIFRALVLNSINFCKSGHLGLPLGNSYTGSKLFWHVLNLYSKKTKWLNRDKFVLSAGHGSIFLYTFLFLTGYKYTLTDLFLFRKLNSKSPGHPEYDMSLGVEATTGPLGQGVANSVGVGLSDRFLASTFYVKNIITNHTICFAGDGCLQEGITQESISLAGNLKLKNLIVIYDSNKVTLDSPLKKTQLDNVIKRFKAVGFEVRESLNSSSKDFIEKLLVLKYSDSKKPKLLVSETIIGQGIDEVAGLPKAHGEAGLAYVHKYNNLLIKLDKSPNLIKYSFLLNAKDLDIRKLLTYKKWLNRYFRVNNLRRLNGRTLSLKKLRLSFNFINTPLNKTLSNIPTRECGSMSLNRVAALDNFVLSGSADLFSSCKNYIKGRSYNGLNRNVYFGVREHAMGGVSNGLAYQKHFKMFASTFLTFSDYLRPSIRMSALSSTPVNFVFTHDSVAVGKDGPTHQPVEMLSTLRLIPNLSVLRPFNYWETLGCYLYSYNQTTKPTALILSRQGIKVSAFRSTVNHLSGCLLGAYTVVKESRKLKVLILSTGSDLSLADSVSKRFGGFSRLISIPNLNVKTLGLIGDSLRTYSKDKVRVVVIESGLKNLWFQLDTRRSNLHIFGLDSFGKSGGVHELLDFFKLRTKYIVRDLKKSYN